VKRLDSFPYPIGKTNIHFELLTESSCAVSVMPNSSDELTQTPYSHEIQRKWCQRLSQTQSQPTDQELYLLAAPAAPVGAASPRT
jgi:hypothetical protein